MILTKTIFPFFFFNPIQFNNFNCRDQQPLVEKVIDRKIYDPVLTAQIANGFALKRLLPGYFPNDSESRGYATFLEWINLSYVGDLKKTKSSRYVRACAVQYEMRMIKSFDDFARDCEYFVDVASDYRCDIALFPEMITMQLLSFLPNKSPGTAIRQLHQCEVDPVWLGRHNVLLEGYQIMIIMIYIYSSKWIETTHSLVGVKTVCQNSLKATLSLARRVDAN